VLDRLSGGEIKIDRTLWLTRFRIHHRMVRDFQKGRVFLAGDAAHIHSPVGGQGMNTGIQDALNLAHKLAAVLNGRRAFDDLRNYELERRPVARGVLRGTDFAFRMALWRETAFARWTRRSVLPHLLRRRWLQKRVLTLVSEVKVARREIARWNSGN
jgi:2-polyprenyl-6-methoxyphenol hydroxylase-like FAD-dependent oxidoreductase